MPSVLHQNSATQFNPQATRVAGAAATAQQQRLPMQLLHTN